MSTGIETSGPITSVSRGTTSIADFGLGIGGSWYFDKSNENGPLIGAGFEGGISAAPADDAVASAAAGGEGCLQFHEK